MRTIQILWISILVLLFSSCAKKDKQDNEETKIITETPQADPSVESGIPDSVLIVGIWQADTKKGVKWFEFTADLKCTNGQADSLRHENVEYKINTLKKELIIYLPNGARLFEYKLKDNELGLKMGGKNKAIRFYRVDKRP
ncbi:hypothetical protein ACFLRI_00740 [Bacteroidota bacterium]